MKSNAKKIVYVVLAVMVVAALLLSIDYFTDGAFGQVGSDSDNVGGETIKDPTLNMTYGEKLVYGLETAGVGMGMVFLVLIILWGVISFIPKILPSEASAAPAKKAPAAVKADVASSDEEELVAVCTAAIAASRGNSDCAFKVISITEIN